MNTNGLELCLALNLAHAGLRLRLDDELGTFHGIDFKDFALLHQLAQAKDCRATLRELVRPLGMPRSALLRQLLVLEKIGLVARDGEGNQRAAVLRPAGRAVVDAARETIRHIAAQATTSLSPRAIAAAHASLVTLAEAPVLALD